MHCLISEIKGNSRETRAEMEGPVGEGAGEEAQMKESNGVMSGETDSRNVFTLDCGDREWEASKDFRVPDLSRG